MHINYQRRKKPQIIKHKQKFLNKIQNEERSKYIFTQYLFATPKTKSTCRYKTKSSYSRVIMNVRQNLFLTFSTKKKKNLKFFEICFLSFRPYVTVTAGSRVRGNLSRFILPVPAEISHQIPTIPIQCTSCFFSLFFFLSLPSFSCSRVVVNFEEHRIKLLMFSSFRNAPEFFF